ncbi:isoprenylcysteine carboxylmethyltransferase family protein [soil metagenome]
MPSAHAPEHDSPLTTPRNTLVEWSLRLCAIAVYAVMIYGVASAWFADTTRYSLLMLMVSEAFTLGLILCARVAVRRDVSVITVLATVYSSCFFALFDNANALHLIPEWAAATLQVAGLAVQVTAKATLGRSFGVLPAARGLVTGGLYRIVRHPIYLGYMIGNLGFLLANASLRNLLVLLALLLTQVLRILREETVLGSGGAKSAYDNYRSRVRFRLLPYVF